MWSIHRLFPLLAVAGSVFAWAVPAPFIEWKTAIVPALIIIMFCMGLTLQWADFQRVWQRPRPILVGVVLQFVLMPFIAWVLATVLQLPEMLKVGLVLVGACAGGTASNVITYLAGGNVALSVSMTLLSTLLSVVLTPYLVWFYVGAEISVDLQGMIVSIAKIVILPIIGGALLNQYLPVVQRRLNAYLPYIATLTIVMIIMVIVALNAAQISNTGYIAAVAIILHNALGLGSAYGLARLLGQTEIEARTIAIEVGMQNSGLGVTLALKFYGVAAALPGALFSIWHNVSGSILAAFWKKRLGAYRPPE